MSESRNQQIIVGLVFCADVFARTREKGSWSNDKLELDVQGLTCGFDSVGRAVEFTTSHVVGIETK